MAAVFALATVEESVASPSARDHQRPAGIIADWVSSIGLMVHLVTAIVVLRWIYLAAAAAGRVSDRIAVTPGWAVGRFFLPILNLWRPFKGVAEIWWVSVDPAAPDSVPTPALVRWWWGLWLAAGLFGHIGGSIFDEARKTDIVEARWTDIILFAIDIPLVWTLIRIVAQITSRLLPLLTPDATPLDRGDAP